MQVLNKYNFLDYVIVMRPGHVVVLCLDNLLDPPFPLVDGLRVSISIGSSILLNSIGSRDLVHCTFLWLPLQSTFYPQTNRPTTRNIQRI